VYFEEFVGFIGYFWRIR